MRMIQVTDQDRHEVKSLESSGGDNYTWGMDLSGTLQGAGGVGGLLMEGNRYTLYDANGNITQKLGSTGTLDMAVEYGPFGELISGSMVGAYGFSTKWQDPVTGMHDYGFRWYSASLGRWLNRDPIGERGGLNLYGFVGNSPLGRVDVLGLSFDPFAAFNVGKKVCCKDGRPVSAYTHCCRAQREAWQRANDELRAVRDHINGYANEFNMNSETEGWFEAIEAGSSVFNDINDFLDVGGLLPDYLAIDWSNGSIGLETPAGAIIEFVFLIGEELGGAGSEVYHNRATAANQALYNYIMQEAELVVASERAFAGLQACLNVYKNK